MAATPIPLRVPLHVPRSHPAQDLILHRMTAIQLEDLPVTTKHLNQIELSRRWCISPRTLERWRWLRQGPNYLKVGGRIVYRLDDIEEYERRHVYAAGGNGSEGGR